MEERWQFFILLGSLIAGCSTGSSSLPDLGPVDMAIDKAAACASTFGTALTAGFGRFDGTVTAIVKPTDQGCAMPNDDHVVVQATMNGAVYRMVVNVLSTRGADTKVRYAELPHALPGVPFAEGWHLNEPLDYVTTLGAHSTASFVPLEMNPLVAKINDRIQLGAKISVYSSTSGGASTHLIHRNKTNEDGALVLDPDGASPTFLLFHFPEQTF